MHPSAATSSGSSSPKNKPPSGRRPTSTRSASIPTRTRPIFAEADCRCLDVGRHDVLTSNVKSKPKRRGVVWGKTRRWKKAVVQAKPGELDLPSSRAWRPLEKPWPCAEPKPTSPGRRLVMYPDFAEITRDEPEKSLVEGLNPLAVTYARGRKTSRHRGGGAKGLDRKVDFKRRKDGVPAQGRGRSRTTCAARLATSPCCTTRTGSSVNTPAPQRLRCRHDGRSPAPAAHIAVGNCLELGYMPQSGTPRSGPSSFSLAGVARMAAWPAPAILSSWPRRPAWSPCACPRARCGGPLGVSRDRRLRSATPGRTPLRFRIGKAGRKCHMGVRPWTRGTAMNPVDHPHGGGVASPTCAAGHPAAPSRAPTLGLPHAQEGQGLLTVTSFAAALREGAWLRAASTRRGRGLRTACSPASKTMTVENTKHMVNTGRRASTYFSYMVGDTIAVHDWCKLCARGS